MWEAYTWMIAVHGIIAFGNGFAVGANDVANSFGTSVGSKTLKLWAAIAIAAVFEFLGAMFMGGSVTSTIAGSIARTSTFASTPALFMYGMLCAEAGAMVWALFATYMELPISTTHSIVSGVIGFALVYGGKDAVVWWQYRTTFPYIGGIVPVIVSWLISPLLAALISLAFYTAVRALVLRRSNSTKIAYWALPAFIFITVWANLYFILTKGARAVLSLDFAMAAAITTAVAGGCTILSIVFGLPLVSKKLNQMAEENPEGSIKPAFVDMDTDGFQKRVADKLQLKEVDPEDRSMGAHWQRLRNLLLAGIATDVHKEIERDRDLMAMHDAAEQFKPETEEVFKYLQVVSACTVAFAHGANEVGNAIGPFNAAFYVYKNMKVPTTSVECPPWLLAYGGASLVVGLVLYGHHIMKVIAVKCTHVSPARGFCMETATSFVVSIATVFSIPLSTTHTITGAVAGPGLAEGGLKGINVKQYTIIFFGWFCTFFAASGMAALFYALGTYSPSIPQNGDINFYQSYLLSTARNELSALNSSNYAAAAFNSTLNSTISEIGSRLSTFQAANAHYDPSAIRAAVDQAFQLFNSSVSIA